MASLRLQRLRPPLLASVDLSIAAGALVFISGPSGAGKSLLLRAVADLDPNTGEAFVGDLARSRLSAPEWRRRVGLLPAESGWWEETVGAHYPPGLRDRQAEDARVALDPLALLHRLGFDADVLDWSVGRLSTGERQRLALARLLAYAPEALLLDEATANLDPLNRERVEAAVDAYRKQHAAAVLWVSHDPEQRARIGDQSLVIREGRLLPEHAA